ncbi:hypothetical protein Hanom_Chr02g00148621 [Helianthus anomalus]
MFVTVRIGILLQFVEISPCDRINLISAYQTLQNLFLSYVKFAYNFQESDLELEIEQDLICANDTHIYTIPSMKYNISLIWYLFDGRGGTGVTVSPTLGNSFPKFI